MTTPTRTVHALVRIGRGEKLHPAIVTWRDTDPGMPWNRRLYGVRDIVCSCPDTANGYAQNRATIARVGEDAWEHRTCRPTEGSTT